VIIEQQGNYPMKTNDRYYRLSNELSACSFRLVVLRPIYNLRDSEAELGSFSATAVSNGIDVTNTFNF
jgi:hypothetical protein